MRQPVREAPSNFHRRLPASCDLAAESQFLDQAPVALQVSLLQVIEEPPSASDQLEQSAAGMMILPVGAEMVGQLVDPAREKGDLDLGRARVRIVLSVPGDDFSLGFVGESHSP